MKKIVMLLLIALCSSPVVMAQSFDDLYYVPKKEKPQKNMVESRKENRDRTSVSSGIPVVVKDRNGKVRNADEYNRRYDASDNNFGVKNDTLYVEEQENADRGRWVNGFNGSADDYEYAQRIIRFRNPRFAVSISSPYYWDIVYGVNSWDWNVYTDDYYAYAFPTFSNRLWWDWRYGSYRSLGIGFGWNYPYYAGYYGNYYGGYWGSNYGDYYGWNPYYSWGHSGFTSRNVYYNNRRSDFGDINQGRSYSRRSSTDSYNYRNLNSRVSSSRVVGTRVDDYSVSRRSEYARPTGVNTRSSSNDWNESRRSTYTRPSSTRSYSTDGQSSSRRGSYSYGSAESSPRNSSYSRGSSSNPTNTYNSDNYSRRSSSYNSDNSSRSSYTPSTSRGGSESYRSNSSSSSSSSGSSRSRR